jgi:hypothetical protein
LSRSARRYSIAVRSATSDTLNRAPGLPVTDSFWSAVGSKLMLD